MRIINFLGNSSLMMLTALVISLAIGGFPTDLPLSNGDISMLSLILMMTISLSTINLRSIKVGPHKKDIRNAFILSFIVSTGITIAMAYLFSGDLRSGWILEASVPSAVSVISFTYLWGGDTGSSAVSSVVVYIVSLGLTPFITFLFLGEAVSEITLLYYVGALIVIPIIFSRLVRRLITSAEVRNILINLFFFVLVIDVAGANRDVFFTAGMVVVLLTVLAFIRTFGIGLIFYHHSMKNGAGRRKTVQGTLFATYKNTGMAAALALVLLGPVAAVPAAVCMVVEVFWLIFAGRFLFPKNVPEADRSIAERTTVNCMSWIDSCSVHLILYQLYLYRIFRYEDRDRNCADIIMGASSAHTAL